MKQADGCTVASGLDQTLWSSMWSGRRYVLLGNRSFVDTAVSYVVSSQCLVPPRIFAVAGTTDRSATSSGLES
jgi:hypothetical protein